MFHKRDKKKSKKHEVTHSHSLLITTGALVVAGLTLLLVPAFLQDRKVLDECDVIEDEE